MELGSWMSVVKMNVRSVIPVVARAEHEEAQPRAGLRPDPQMPGGHQREDHERHRAADRGDGGQVEEHDHDHDDDRRDQQPDRRASAQSLAHDRRELARRGQVLRQPGCGVEPGVRRSGCGEQRRDDHQPEAGITQDRLGGDSDRRRPGGDDVGHAHGPEHAQGHRHVDGRGQPDRDRHGPRQLARRVGQILGGERHHAEAEEGEERQGDAGHDVTDARITGRRESREVRVQHRDHREEREDAHHHEDDDALDPRHERRTGDVQQGHRRHEHHREQLRRGRVVVGERGARIAAE